MKKIKSLLVMSAILLAGFTLVGCGKSGQDMTFDEAYKHIFSTNAIGQHVKNIDTTKTLSEVGEATISASMEDGFLLSGVIRTKGIYDISGSNELALGFSGGINLPSANTQLDLDFNILSIIDAKRILLNIDSFYLKPTSSDAQLMQMANFISPLVNTIGKQWIDLTPTVATGGLTMADLNITPYMSNIVTFMTETENAINNYPLFQELEKTEIDGKLAYKIGWNQSGVSGFVNHILQNAKNLGENITFPEEEVAGIISNILETPLQGYIIVKNEKDVVLRIDSLLIKAPISEISESGELVESEETNKFSITHSTKDGAIFTGETMSGEVMFTGDAKTQGTKGTFNMYFPAEGMTIQAEIPKGWESITLHMFGAGLDIEIVASSKLTSLDNHTPTEVGETKSLQDIISGLTTLLGVDPTGLGLPMEEIGTGNADSASGSIQDPILIDEFDLISGTPISTGETTETIN